jgi:hypothetical protein
MFPKGYAKLITAAAAGLLLQPFFLQTSFGQNRGAAPPATGTPSGATGTPTTTTPNTGRTPTTIPNTTNPNPTTPSLPQPIFLTGRVMIDDGTPLSEPLVIQRVCNG